MRSVADYKPCEPKKKQIRITRPSILCVTHQMNHKTGNYSALPYEMINYKWYQQVLGQYKVILSGTWWYWVSIGCHYLPYDGTGSVQDGTGWYLVVLGQ